MGRVRRRDWVRGGEILREQPPVLRPGPCEHSLSQLLLKAAMQSGMSLDDRTRDDLSPHVELAVQRFLLGPFGGETGPELLYPLFVLGNLFGESLSNPVHRALLSRPAFQRECFESFTAPSSTDPPRAARRESEDAFSHRPEPLRPSRTCGVAPIVDARALPGRRYAQEPCLLWIVIAFPLSLLDLPRNCTANFRAMTFHSLLPQLA